MATNGKAFVLGYTGGTGSALIEQLSRDSFFTNVVLIGRRQVDLVDFELEDETKFSQRVVDFDNLKDHEDAFKGCDIGFCCLGALRSRDGKEMFLKVDRDYTLESARIAKSAGCKHFLLVSSTSANKNSMILYLKIKGEVEETLKEMSFQRLSIFRPGALLGREKCRWAETCGKCFWFPCLKLCPARWGVRLDVLSLAMIVMAKRETAEPVEVFNNGQIIGLAKMYNINEAYFPADSKKEK